MQSAVKLQLKARGQRPAYFADPAIDQVLSITLALAGEVAVLRDRLDTVERMLENGVPVTRAAIAAHVPDAVVRAERDAWRECFLDVVLRAVHQEREALERADPMHDYKRAVESVERPDHAVEASASG